MSTTSSYQFSIEKGSKYEPEAGRYVLYVSLGCPFAHRVMIVLGMKKLQNVIKVAHVSPVFGVVDEATQTRSWVFGHPGNKQCPGLLADLIAQNPIENVQDEDLKQYLQNIDLTRTSMGGLDITDPFMNTRSLKEIYDIDNQNTGIQYVGRFTVPTLFDLHTKTIVSNESPHIMALFDAAFDEFTPVKTSVLNPQGLSVEQLQVAINELNMNLVFGPSKVGLAKNHLDHITAAKKLYTYLDQLEELLGKQRFILGEQFSHADVYATVVLFRFDPAYGKLFKCNYKTIQHDYKNIFAYLRDIYQNVWDDEVKGYYNIDHILYLSFCAKPEFNPNYIIPYQQIIDYTTPVTRNF